MEQFKLSLVCLRKDFAAQCEEKMGKEGISEDPNSGIILLDYVLLQDKRKLKGLAKTEHFENKKIIVIFEQELSIKILSEILFEKNIFGILAFEQFGKIRNIIEKITLYDKKKEFTGKETKKFLLKELGNNSKKALGNAKEDLSLKFVLENEFGKKSTTTETGKKISYHLNCEVNEARLLIVGLFLALYSRESMVILKSEALRLKYGMYLAVNLKTSGKGEIGIFVKTKDLIINSSKEISNEVIEKLQRMIKD
jgi:hypothetical protein